MGDFRAHVQYGDWEGTAAADASDQLEIHKYLRDKGLLQDNEFLLAVNIFVGENHHNEVGSVYVAAFIYEGQDSFDKLKPILDKSTGPIPVRSVRLTLTLQEFVGLFKRFDVFLTWHGLNLADRDYDAIKEVEPTE
jgi:hypothetical protein